MSWFRCHRALWGRICKGNELTSLPKQSSNSSVLYTCNYLMRQTMIMSATQTKLRPRIDQTTVWSCANYYSTISS